MRKIIIVLLLINIGCANSQEDTNEETGIPVFAYHRFGDDRFPSTNIKMEVFKKQLDYLKNNNYHVLTLKEAVKAMKEGEVQSKSVVLTVDDGYKSFYENAFPLLQEYGYPVTIFVNTSYVGGDDFMDWETLKIIKEAGMEIGNHSHDHPHFLNAQAPVTLLHSDVETAQSLFKEHLGFEPGAFSYPYGEYDEHLKEALEGMGFYAATAQRSGVMSGREVFAIPRFPMGGPFASFEGFKRKIKMLPLHVVVIKPGSTTSPEDRFVFSIEEEIAPGTVQCFVDGTKQSLNKDVSRFELKVPESGQRRQLITVTAKVKGAANYGWFSFVRINTKAEE